MKNFAFSFMRFFIILFVIIAVPIVGLAANSTTGNAANNQPGVMIGNGHYKGDGHDHTTLGNGHYRGDGHDHAGLRDGHYRGDGHDHTTLDGGHYRGDGHNDHW